MNVALRALTVAFALLCGALCGLPGCASSPEEAAPPPAAGGEAKKDGTAAEGREVAASGTEEASAGPRRRQKATGAERAGQYALAVPKNLAWIPWKLLGSGFKGASDGVQAGFDKGRMPLFGVLFSPVNLVVGLGTGIVEGLIMSPGVVGPDDDFGRAMSLPTKRETSIWWYP